MWVWEGEVGAAGRLCVCVWGGGVKCVPSAIGCGSKCLIMRLIVPLLCRQYKYTPVGPEGDSLDRLTPVDRLIFRLNNTNSEK